MAKAKITRIKANDHESIEKTSDQPVITRKKVVIEDKATKKAKKAAKKALKSEEKTKEVKPKKQKVIKHPKLHKILMIITAPFRFIFKPFAKLGHYVADSWREIRQVRWPNRKATWKMVIAVIIYTAIFVAFITLIDALLTLIFNNFLK